MLIPRQDSTGRARPQRDLSRFYQEVDSIFATRKGVASDAAEDPSFSPPAEDPVAPDQPLLDALDDDNDEGFMGAILGTTYGRMTEIVARTAMGGVRTAGNLVGAGARGAARGVVDLSAQLHNLAGIAEEKAIEAVTGEDQPQYATDYGRRAAFLRGVADTIGRNEAVERAAGKLQAARDARPDDRIGGFAVTTARMGLGPEIGQALDDIARDISDLANMPIEESAAYVGDLVGANAPQLVPVIAAHSAGGPLGAYGMGALLSTSGSLAEASTQIDGVTPRDATLKDIAVATATGAVAGAFDMLGARGIHQFSRDLLKNLPLDKATSLSVRKEFVRALLMAERTRQTEGFTEVVQTSIENLGAKYSFDPDRLVSGGLGESYIAGWMLGNMSAGGVVNHTANVAVAKKLSGLGQELSGIVDQNADVLGADLDAPAGEMDAQQDLPQPAHQKLTEEQLETAKQQALETPTEGLLDIIDDAESYPPEVVEIALAEFDARVDNPLTEGSTESEAEINSELMLTEEQVQDLQKVWTTLEDTGFETTMSKKRMADIDATPEGMEQFVAQLARLKDIAFGRQAVAPLLPQGVNDIISEMERLGDVDGAKNVKGSAITSMLENDLDVEKAFDEKRMEVYNKHLEDSRSNSKEEEARTPSTEQFVPRTTQERVEGAIQLDERLAGEKVSAKPNSRTALARSAMDRGLPKSFNKVLDRMTHVSNEMDELLGSIGVKNAKQVNPETEPALYALMNMGPQEIPSFESAVRLLSMHEKIERGYKNAPSKGVVRGELQDLSKKVEHRAGLLDAARKEAEAQVGKEEDATAQSRMEAIMDASETELIRMAVNDQYAETEMALVEDRAASLGIMHLVDRARQTRIQSITHGTPMTIEEVNKLNRRQMIKEANKRGIPSPKNYATPDLARMLIQDELPTFDRDHTTEEEYWGGVLGSNSRFDILEAMLMTDRTENHGTTEKEAYLADFLSKHRLHAEAWVKTHDLAADDPAKRRRYMATKSTTRGGEGLGTDEAVMRLNELAPEYDFTEQDIVDFVSNNDSPAQFAKDANVNPRWTALKERYVELTGRKYSDAELRDYEKYTQTRAVQESVIREDADSVVSEMLTTLLQKIGVTSTPTLRDLQALVQELQDPGAGFVYDLTQEEIYYATETIRGIIQEETAADRSGKSTGDAKTQSDQTDQSDSEDPGQIDLHTAGFSLSPEAETTVHTWFMGAKEKGRRAWMATIFPQGNMPKQVFDVLFKTEHRKDAWVKQAELRKRDLYIAQKAATGRSEFSRSELKNLRKFMMGELHAPLSKEVEVAAMRMRTMLDTMSRKLIDSGAATGDLAAIIEANNGIYFTRTFRVHTDPKWAKRLRNRAKSGDKKAQEILNTARDRIRHRLHDREAKRGADKEYRALYLDPNDKTPFVTPKMRSSPEWQELYKDYFDNTNISNRAIEAEMNGYLVREGTTYAARSARLKKNLGIFKKRQNLEGWELALMGEHVSPTENFLASVAKISSLLETHLMLKDLADTLGNRAVDPVTGQLIENPVFIHPEDWAQYQEESGFSDEGWIAVSSEGNDRLSPLDGYRMPKEVAEALEEAVGAPTQLAGWARSLVYANGIYKAGKVVYSAQTQVRNHISASLFVLSQGYSPTVGYAEAFRLAANLNLLSRTGTFTTEEEGFMLRLLREGVLNENTMANDIARTIKDANPDALRDDLFLGDKEIKSDKILSKVREWAIRKPQQSYMFGDNVWKIVLFKREYASLEKIYPGEAATEEGRNRLFAKAAEITRNVSPTYSMVSPAIQNLRKFPGMGPFVAFHYEATRTFINTVLQAKREVTEGLETKNEALWRRGAARAVGAMTAVRAPAAMWTGVAAAMQATIWADEDDEEKNAGFNDERDKAALRELLPEWYANTDITPLKQVGDKVYYMNVGFINPWNSVSDPTGMILRAVTDKTWAEGDITSTAIEAMWATMGPYTDPELFVRSMAEAMVGVDESGREIYNKEVDSPSDQIAKGVGHILTEGSPGIVQQFQRITDPSRSTGVETLATFTGHRISTLSIDKTLSLSGAAPFSRGKQAISRELVDKLSVPNLTKEEARSAFEEANEKLEKVYGALYVKASAAAHLMREPDIGIMLQGKISAEDEINIMLGEWQPYRNYNILLKAIGYAEEGTPRHAWLTLNDKIVGDVLAEMDTSPRRLSKRWQMNTSPK